MHKVVEDNRLVVVSNRLPAEVVKEDGEWNVRPGAGGLVTALEPVVQRNRGLWVGWPGTDHETPYEELLADYSEQQRMDLKGVGLTGDEIDNYYYGFANEALWPLFHRMIDRCKFNQEDWEAYAGVNRKFAEAVAEEVGGDDIVWAHDYHLLRLASELRDLGVEQPLAFFLHIPFPPPDLFHRLPWREQVIDGLLDYDLVGFQTRRDLKKFADCVEHLFPDIDYQEDNGWIELTKGERSVRASNFPIGIDTDEFTEVAHSQESLQVADHITSKLPDRQLMLGVDRLDYAKGLPERFHAFERALEKYPELRGKISLLQIVVPSRMNVPEYQRFKDRLDRIVGHINGRFTRHGWIPLHYMFTRLDREELVGYYRASDIGLITPLSDGMNLVAKEYCTCSLDNNGVLVLSEFAGVSEQMRDGALIVNPYDLEQTADAINQAFEMPPAERKERMEKLRNTVEENDIHRWLESFLTSLKKLTGKKARA